MLTDFVVTVSGSHRRSNQEVMQPVGVILEAVEIVKGRYLRVLVTPQARDIRDESSIAAPLRVPLPTGRSRWWRGSSASHRAADLDN
jgi:hypothetical protein